jgi:hypothetical protein
MTTAKIIFPLQLARRATTSRPSSNRNNCSWSAAIAESSLDGKRNAPRSSRL